MMKTATVNVNLHDAHRLNEDEKMTGYTYYTDGAATMINSNGKYLRKEGGWAYICLKDGEIIERQSGGCPLTTNNEMELYAIYASLKNFSEICGVNDDVEICSDSGYSIDIFTKWIGGWQRNGWRKSDGKAIKNSNIIKAIWKLMGEIENNGCSIGFTKVRGHSGNMLNQEADRLAVEAKRQAKITGKTTGYNNEPDSLLGSKK